MSVTPTMMERKMQGTETRAAWVWLLGPWARAPPGAELIGDFCRAVQSWSPGPSYFPFELNSKARSSRTEMNGTAWASSTCPTTRQRVTRLPAPKAIGQIQR